MKRAGLILCTLAALVRPAEAAPAQTIRDLYVALDRCVNASSLEAGTDVTLVFMLNRKGALIGKPRLTHAVWPKGADPRAQGADIAARFDGCLPLDISDSLGGAIAGRLIAYRVRPPPRDAGLYRASSRVALA